jgi:NitT/TauT family transport system permease protein
MNSLAQPAKWERYCWPTAALVLFLVLWHAAVKWTGTTVFPGPIDVEKGMAELFRKGLLLSYVGDSLRRVGIGFSLAVILGVPFGLTLGWFPTTAQIVNPSIQMLRPISPIAWIPIAIVWFGIGDAAPVYLIFLGALFPIVVASMNSVRNIPSVFRRAGRNFGLNSLQLVRKVVFPAAFPQIVVSLRIALGIAWLVVVAAEMIAVDSGLGYLVIDSRNSGKRYDLVVAAMLLIGSIGLALDFIIRSLEKLKSVRWRLREY